MCRSGGDRRTGPLKCELRDNGNEYQSIRSSFFGKTEGKRLFGFSTDLAMYLLKDGHVATVGGDAFGAPDYFRMSYATSEDNIQEAAKRIKEVLGRLR